jgi:glycine oxidase
MRILIVGGGVIGCAIARELAGSGCRVILLEKGRVGSEASWAAAGILCSQLDVDAPSPLLQFGLKAFAMYPEFVEQLRQETGIDAELDIGGVLVPNMTREDAADSERMYRWQGKAGLPVEFLSPREVAGLEDSLSNALLGGVLFPKSGRVDPVALTRGLAASGRRRGVEIREGCPVASLRNSGDRVTGVELASGESLEGDVTIVASGAWSGQLLPTPVQIFPVRGQMLVFETHRPPRRHVLVTPRVYLVYRRDGTVLAGSTLEREGFKKGVTPKALLKLTASALALDPELASADFAGAWSGLRPGSSDELPLIGPVRQGLMVATGHYRNGILLAPITATGIARCVLTGKPEPDLEAFAPLRVPPAGAGQPPA